MPLYNILPQYDHTVDKNCNEDVYHDIHHDLSVSFQKSWEKYLKLTKKPVCEEGDIECTSRLVMPTSKTQAETVRETYASRRDRACSG